MPNSVNNLHPVCTVVNLEDYRKKYTTRCHGIIGKPCWKKRNTLSLKQADEELTEEMRKLAQWRSSQLEIPRFAPHPGFYVILFIVFLFFLYCPKSQ